MPMLDHQRHAVGFLLRHCAFGTLGGFLFGALFLYFDIFGLGSMIFASPDRNLFLLMLFFGLFITFGSLGMGVGIMGLGEERD